jgi:hypothetical protein
VRVTAGQKDIAEATHGRVGGFGPAERCDLAAFEQEVIHGQEQLVVGRRPVVGIGRYDDDVAIQAELLGVVLAHVGVVPVESRIRTLDATAEPPTDRDGLLGLVRHTVILIVQPQPVPVHRGLQVAVVGDVDDDLRTLPHPERGAGDRAVVGEHADGRVAEVLGYRPDGQLQGVAVGEVHDRRRPALRQAGRVGRKVVVRLHRGLPAPGRFGDRLAVAQCRRCAARVASAGGAKSVCTLHVCGSVAC